MFATTYGLLTQTLRMDMVDNVRCNYQWPIRWGQEVGGGVLTSFPQVNCSKTCYLTLKCFVVKHLNMLKITYDSSRQDFKPLTCIVSNLNNFHPFEVVDRVSETQLEVSENSN